LQILHPSLADYLLDTSQPTLFHINKGQVHYLLFQKSVNILCTQLKFNICNLETSHIPNTQISDLEDRITTDISHELQYSSQFWVYHV
ncbi:hypothetical protein BDN72DRAFT_746305, partial [Pluteus cervinus]